MKNSYNAQEEISDLSAKLNEFVESTNKRISELENLVSKLQRALNDIMVKADIAERGRRRTEIKVEDLQGTLAEKLRTLGQITKWDKK